MYLEGEAPTKSKEENKEILKEHHLLLVIMNGSQKRYEQIDGIERGKMEQIELDGITFRLKTWCDFSWLRSYGTAFRVIDATGSGCLCIGMQKGSQRYFLKIAGADTIYAEVPPDESIRVLKNAAGLYQELAHPNLIHLIEHFPHENLYVAVFDWVEGECLFDFWNFEKYTQNKQLIRPSDRFHTLSARKKLQCAEVLFSFLEKTAEKGYVAVDFYDGSIMYDFNTDQTMICDIDFFRKMPAYNNMGEKLFGTKRLKSPEEYILGAKLDEKTNVFTLGALLFDFFGEFSSSDIAERYMKNAFSPCDREKWELNTACYEAAGKAVSAEKNSRYRTIREFHLVWEKAVDSDTDI